MDDRDPFWYILALYYTVSAVLIAIFGLTLGLPLWLYCTIVTMPAFLALNAFCGFPFLGFWRKENLFPWREK
jgi:hypothetical protein